MAGLLSTGVQQPFTSLKAFTPAKPLPSLRLHHRRVLQCQAAASGYSLTPPVPAGDVNIPMVSDALNTLEWLNDYQAFYEKRYKKYGGFFRTNVMGNPLVVVSDQNEIKRLLQAEHKLVESSWPTSMVNLMGEHSILYASAAVHKTQRHILSQAFTEAAMRQYMPSILDVANRTLEQWAASADPVTFYNASRCFAFDVAATVLTGARFDGGQLEELRQKFDVYVEGLFQVPVPLPWTKYGRALKARDAIVEEIVGLIRAAQASNDNAEGSGAKRGRRNALQLLLEAQDEDGIKLSMDQLKDQVLTQLFAGHETTGATITSLLPELQKNPAVMAELRQEQARLVQCFGPDITYEMLAQMPYADAVLNEVLRMHSVVDGVWRRALEDLTIQGHHIPEGWTLQLMVRRASLELPEFAADAEVFLPERWLNDKGCPFSREPKGYMPFGDGPRKCLGMPLAKTELRVLMAVLARGFDFELEDPDEPWCMGFRPINDLPGKVWKLQS